MFCPNCGKPVSEGDRFCPNCGKELNFISQPAVSPLHPPSPVAPRPGAEVSRGKDWLAVLLLSFFNGWLGIDRFYLGYIGLGVLKAVTLGGCGIWGLVDFLLILFNKLPDANGVFPEGREGKEWVGYLLLGIGIMGFILWGLMMFLTSFMPVYHSGWESF